MRAGLEEAFSEIPIRSKISTKAAAFTLITALIPTMFVLFVGFSVFKDSMREQAIKNMELIAEAQGGQLLIFLEGIEKRVVDFSSDGFIRDSVKNIISDAPNTETVRKLNRHLKVNKMSLDETIYGINVLDLSGKIIASTNETEIGKDESEDDYFIDTLNLDYGEAHISDVGQSYHFNVNIRSINSSAILTDKNSGEKIGVIIVYLDAKNLSDILSGEYQTILRSFSGVKGRGITTDVYLVNKNKILITKSRYPEEGELFKQVVNMNR